MVDKVEAKQEASFLKKRSKKLLIAWSTPATVGALQLTKFFCFFLFTKRRFFLRLNLLLLLIIFADERYAWFDARSRAGALK